MKFYIVSADRPNSDYIEENFDEIINSSEFAMHEDTKQKGTFFAIEEGDVLILKYDKKFVAYGIAVRRFEDFSKKFPLRVEVKDWIFYDKELPRKGIARNGIRKATIGGGAFGTVKSIRPNFGLDKVRQINSDHPTFKIISDTHRLQESSLRKEGEFFKLHEEVFNFLLNKSESDAEFTFVVRDSNNANSLENGYWFFGEETIAISFWTGMDYENNRPAISFLINQNRHCELIIQTKVYPHLQEFLRKEKFFVERLGLNLDEELYTKTYDRFLLTDYMVCLEDFLRNDFNLIDRIVNEAQEKGEERYSLNDDANIQRFPINEFNLRLNNLFRYRSQNPTELEIYSQEDEQRADTILNVSISEYALIKNEFLDFGKARWVFITGENGSGKTMLLRAISTGLGNRTMSRQELSNNDFKLEATLQTHGREIPFSRTRNINVKSKRAIVSRGLAMYGPYRLQQTTNLVKDETFRKALSKTGSFKSLFEDSSKLLSLDKQLEIWTTASRSKKSIADSRIKRVLSLLPKIIPDLRQVQYKRKRYNKYEFDYLIQSEGTDELMSLKWHELSSGNRSILNLVSDIIIRLFYQQPKVTDPSELRGIVLIDEIDLHLHPKAQRDLVVTLSETFPLIQFIVTTHSPIPLLGAPENSAIFVVKRDWERGVYAQRLKKLENEFKLLLPNTLLTSDIFDFDIMEDIPEEKLSTYLEDDYNDIQKNKNVEERLKSLDKSIFPKDLFKDKS